jgi:murein DD-endopeptidase
LEDKKEIPIITRVNMISYNYSIVRHVRALFVSLFLVGTSSWSQSVSDVPADIDVPVHPIPVKANGKVHLLYELHLTNFRTLDLEVTRLKVSDGSEGKLAEYTGPELAALIGHPGVSVDATRNQVIGGGTRAVVFLDVTFASQANVSQKLIHRLCFRAQGASAEDKCLDDVSVPVHLGPAIVLGPPLRGEGWVALNGLSNSSGHRRTLVVVNGKVHMAQRFATDWSRVGSDGLAFRGDPANTANWSPYGAEVLAVGDAVVVDVKDGIPDNNPAADKKAVPITLETVGGNYIILDLRNGFYAFYAHLKPGSIRVKINDKVHRGDVLALLGNSGNSDAPHLHFHVTDDNSPLGAEGVPFVFDFFEQQGFLSSKSQLISGGWKPDPKNVTKVQNEMPADNAVVRFY